MTDWNVAEREKRLWENPTLAECERMGSTHYAYGWSATPRWPEPERQEAYRRGYEKAKAHEVAARHP